MAKNHKKLIAVVLIVMCTISLLAYALRGRIMADGARLVPMSGVTTPISEDIFDSYDIDSLGPNTRAENTGVYKRAVKLGIDYETLRHPSSYLTGLRQSVKAMSDAMPVPDGTVTFSGTTSDELQSFIDQNVGKRINIASDAITLTEPVVLRSNTYLYGDETTLSCEGEGQALVAQDESNIVLNGLTLRGSSTDDGCEYGIYLVGCDHLILEDLDVSGFASKGVVLVGSCDSFVIRDSQIRYNLQGGISLIGTVSDGIISSSNISDNQGNSNWMAGLVMTSITTTNALDPWEAFDDTRYFPTRSDLSGQLEAPHDIIVEGCTFARNDAQGIYNDGSYLILLLGNTVCVNQKEGICLDYGTIACYLHGNRLVGNGHRASQSDEALTRDGVSSFGRESDGSAVSKLPAISLDNAAYNVIEGNDVISNDGGGIKTVRTGIYNLIVANTILDNNIGASDSFHYFGIELGNADYGAVAEDMDYVGDYGCIVKDNVISGNHYSGIFLGEQTEGNIVTGNTISGASALPIESISVLTNTIEDNS